MSKAKQTIKGTEKAEESYLTSSKPKKVQPPTSEAEKAKRKAEGKTQGRAGCKMSRINFALTVENDTYVRFMSRVRGESMTDFINHCIEKHKEENQAAYEQLQKIKEIT